VFIEKSEGAGDILFKYLGEIEDVILKQSKRQTLITVVIPILSYY